MFDREHPHQSSNLGQNDGFSTDHHSGSYTSFFSDRRDLRAMGSSALVDALDHRFGTLLQSIINKTGDHRGRAAVTTVMAVSPCGGGCILEEVEC
jgi:hypothetical protein